jgi:cardiolipin synthase A/B
LFAAVDRAQDHIYVENFTLADNRLLVKLAQARRRGVDVRVVLTLAATPDTINRTNRVTANRLFRSGVRVYVCPAMTHLKAATVDGRWAYLGTGNFDILSLRHNRELGLAVAAGPALGEVEDRLFRPDFRPDWEMIKPFALSAGDYFWELLSSVCF